MPGKLLTILLGVLALAMMPATPALATHDEDCRAYSQEDTPVDEIGVEAGALAASSIANELDVAAEVLEEGAPLTKPESKIVGIAAGVASAADFALQSALHVLQSINAEADECRIDRHWDMLDALLNSQIRRDLAATGTPVALFVLPESAGGYIDTPGVGTKAVVEDAITRLKAKGQCTCTQAQTTFDQAVSQMNAGSYKAAYTKFRQAYVYAFSN